MPPSTPPPFPWVLFPTPPWEARTPAHGLPAGGQTRRWRCRGSTAPASPEGPDRGVAEPRPPCPTFGARGGGGGGSGVPVFSHPAAGSAAIKRSRRASSDTRTPSILDWPEAAGGSTGKAGSDRGVQGGGAWRAGRASEGWRAAHRARAPPHRVEGRNQVKKGEISWLDRCSGLERIPHLTRVSFFVVIILKLVIYSIYT